MMIMALSIVSRLFALLPSGEAARRADRASVQISRLSDVSAPIGTDAEVGPARCMIFSICLQTDWNTKGKQKTKTYDSSSAADSSRPDG